MNRFPISIVDNHVRFSISGHSRNQANAIVAFPTSRIHTWYSQSHCQLCYPTETPKVFRGLDEPLESEQSFFPPQVCYIVMCEALSASADELTDRLRESRLVAELEDPEKEPDTPTLSRADGVRPVNDGRDWTV